jgi:hypothetical protein
LDLKANSKKVWPSFPIKLGIFTLSNYQHARVEATTLEKIQLSYIAFKKHDPLNIVHDHCQALSNFKVYKHEDIPFDKVFQRAQSYEEVCKRIEEILEGPKRDEFLAFQRHRNLSLGNIFVTDNQSLQGQDKQQLLIEQSQPSDNVQVKQPEQQQGINLSQVKSWRHHKKMIHKRINQKKTWRLLQLLLFPKLLWHHFQVILLLRLFILIL